MKTLIATGRVDAIRDNTACVSLAMPDGQIIESQCDASHLAAIDVSEGEWFHFYDDKTFKKAKTKSPTREEIDASIEKYKNRWKF